MQHIWYKVVCKQYHIFSNYKAYRQTLYFASEDLRNDRELAKTAVENKGIIKKCFKQ